MQKKEYLILLQKGLSVFDETIALLKLWEHGMTTSELSKITLETGALGRSTDYRIKDIITRIFFRRYVIENENAADNLKILAENNFDFNKIKQIMMVYICKTDDALHDFITEVYWPRFYSGLEIISKEDSMNFLIDAKYNGLMKGSWSDPQMNRIAANLLGILEEFNMVSSHTRGNRTIIPIHINETTLLYFAHELHFENKSDTSIIENSIWSLFGLQPYELFLELERAAYNGNFILQGTYDFLKINWKYKSMKDFLMESLNDNFDEIRHRLKEQTSIKNVGDDPVFYLIFSPEKILDVKSKIKTWKARLVKDGYKVKILSLAKVVNDIFKKYDLREIWIESEAENPMNFEDINSTLADCLLSDDALIMKLKEYFESINNTDESIVFITDIEALHPYLRVGTIEQKLNGCFTVPTIIFYPGTRQGNMLRFLGVYPPDGNYRSVHIGG